MVNLLDWGHDWFWLCKDRPGYVKKALEHWKGNHACIGQVEYLYDGIRGDYFQANCVKMEATWPYNVGSTGGEIRNRKNRMRVCDTHWAKVLRRHQSQVGIEVYLHPIPKNLGLLWIVSKVGHGVGNSVPWGCNCYAHCIGEYLGGGYWNHYWVDSLQHCGTKELPEVIWCNHNERLWRNLNNLIMGGRRAEREGRVSQELHRAKIFLESKVGSVLIQILREMTLGRGY